MANTYKITNAGGGKYFICRGPYENREYFCGYDFMGSINWEKEPSAEYIIDKDEALSIINDLEAADEPTDDPEKKQYFVQIRFDGETWNHMMTGRELADRYETNAEAGIGEEYAAFDVNSFGNPVRINVYELVHPIIERKRWMHQEYLDYCENEAYGDY